MLTWLSSGQFKALSVIPQHGISLLKKGKRQWLYSFCNLGTDVLAGFNFRWQNADAIRSISSLQPDGSWLRLKFSVIHAGDGCSPQIVFQTALNCYDWLVLLVNEEANG